MKRHVALIGFMAAGKSVIGARAARALELEFLDTDALIVAEHGPIPDLFARHGESSFRALERLAAERAFSGEDKVVSLGGGAVTHEPTRILIATQAIRVYLQASPATILQRLRRSPTVRPVLGRAPTVERIGELLDAREPFYQAAEIVVRVDGRRIPDIAREVVDRLRDLRGVAA